MLVYPFLVSLGHASVDVKSLHLEKCDEFVEIKRNGENKYLSNINIKAALFHCEEALKHFPKNGKILLQLGRIYIFQGRKEDGLNLLKSASSDGYSESSYYLGIYYFNSGGGPSEKEKAFQYFKLAAQSGHPEAQRSVGLAYLNGDGTRKSVREGVAWIRRAAKQNEPEALFGLGLMYLRGNNVLRRNLEVAAKYFAMAHEHGHPHGRKMQNAAELTIRLERNN
tara:strand:+ start:447 stop:1118 length:672 start_codon:yes stop_codon:yes gene_type:complete